MLLTEIEEGSTIMVKSYYSPLIEDADTDTNVNFYSTCEEILRNGIITSEICTEDGQPINFKSEIVMSDLYLLRQGESPIKWKNVKIIHFVREGVFKNAMIATQAGMKFNRRGDFRVYVGRSGTVSLGAGRNDIPVMVYDVSASGFSFIMNKSTVVQEKDPLNLRFKEENDKLLLDGVCVRRQKIDDTRILYGCVLRKRESEIEAYVAKKQQQLAKHTNSI